MIVEKSTNADWRCGRKFGNVVFDDGAIVGDFAADIGIDNAGEGKDIVNGDTFRFLLTWIGSHHDGSVLAASVGIFGDVDGKLYFASFVGSNSAGRIGNSDPVGNFGKSRNITDISLVIFADYIIR